MSDSELSSNSLESKLLDGKRNVIRMSSPRAFIEWFRSELHAAGVRFAIASGQAWSDFGIQQTAKDSDWISEAADRYALARSPLDDSAAPRSLRRGAGGCGGNPRGDRGGIEFVI